VSAGSGDWWRFVDDFWRHGDGKFLLSAPMEVILERVRCPWTLNEMDSPAEEERVYIDERKMRNDLC